MMNSKSKYILLYISYSLIDFWHFNRLNRELSRPARTSHTSKKNVSDAEEGGLSKDFTFVDLEEYLTHAHREGTASGILPKQIGIRFRNLTVQGGGSGSIVGRTFYDEMIGVLGKDLYDLAKGYFSKTSPPVKNIIQDFSGVVKPGEMLLVLGKPGSGSSTFLRALTNQRRDYTAIQGEVDYSGLEFQTAKREYRGEILYNGEGG